MYKYIVHHFYYYTHFYTAYFLKLADLPVWHQSRTSPIAVFKLGHQDIGFPGSQSEYSTAHLHIDVHVQLFGVVVIGSAVSSIESIRSDALKIVLVIEMFQYYLITHFKSR